MTLQVCLCLLLNQASMTETWRIVSVCPGLKHGLDMGDLTITDSKIQLKLKLFSKTGNQQKVKSVDLEDLKMDPRGPSELLEIDQS